MLAYWERGKVDYLYNKGDYSMSLPVFLGLLILVAFLIIFIITRFVRSSQKTRREYEQHEQNAQSAPEMFQSGYSSKPSFAKDTPSIGIAIIGFLFPMIGVIMYIAWLNSLPFRARSAGKGALLGAITYVVCIAIIYGIIMGAFS
jgi:hypothetical protein